MTSDASRRAVLGSTATLALGVSFRRLPRPIAAQSSPVSIDRTVGDLVVLPAAPDATVRGTATLDPNTDFGVRVFSQESPAFSVSTGVVVAEDGTWSATVDLIDAVDGQSLTVEAVLGGDVVASADGVVGPISAAVRFDDQELSARERRVHLSSARLELGGFVVVRDAPDGAIRGVSAYLATRRTHAPVPVSLDEPVRGSERLVATAWLDVNADRLFGVGVDRPYPDGNPVSDSAVVAAPPPASETPGPPPSSASGLDVGVAVLGGALGAIGLRGAGARVARAVRKVRGENRPPVANIVAVPESPRPGVPVLFDGSLSFDPDPDDGITRYDWSIGETSASGPRHVHVFGAAEEYDVELAVADGEGAEGRAQETVTVETAGRLELAAVHPDAPGDDRERLHRERLVFENVGEAPLDLSGWTLYDAVEDAGRVSPGSHAFTVPDGFELDGGATVAVHTGGEPLEGPDSDDAADHHLYWGSNVPIWNNSADRIVVDDADDDPVLATRYERTADGEYAIDDEDPATLADWFGPVDLGETVRLPILGVTVSSRIGIRAVENGIDFVKSCLYLRGSAAFARAWALVASFLALSILTWLVSTGSGLLLPSIRIGGPLALLVGAISLTTVGGVAWAVGAIRSLLADLFS